MSSIRHRRTVECAASSMRATGLSALSHSGRSRSRSSAPKQIGRVTTMLKAHPDTRTDFRYVMAPESVVVVGASPTHEWDRLVLDNFSRIHYPGKVVAVNPKYEEI